MSENPKIEDPILIQVDDLAKKLLEIVDENPEYSVAVYAGKVDPTNDNKIHAYTGMNGDIGVILEAMYIDIVSGITDRQDYSLLFGLLDLMVAIKKTLAASSEPDMSEESDVAENMIEDIHSALTQKRTLH